MKNILEVIALTNNRLNPVLWTIAIELVASAFYPLFVPLVRNNHRAALLVAIATGVALSILMPGGMRIFDAAHFLYMFMIGASLNLLQKMEKRRAAALLLLEALLLMLLTRAYGQQHSSLEDLFSTMSSVIIVGVVAFCCPPAVEKLLGHPVMVTLGQSSYSYYLINAPLLYLIVNYYPIFHIKAPDTNLGYVFYSIISGFSAAIVTIPVAIFSAKSFESLSIQWGRRLEEYIVGAAGYSSNSAARLADLGDEMTNQR